MNQQRILVVDDELHIRKVLRDYLAMYGYVVSRAQNGMEGLDILEQSVIDLAIVDLNMPVMSGITLLEKIHPAQIQTSVIVLTGLGSLETAVYVMKLGAVDFVQKPIIDLKEFF